MITCRLKEEPLPLPTFQWIITLNETDLAIAVGNITVNGMYLDNDTLVFPGNVITELDQYSVLNVTCNVSNPFGNATRTTSIKICGMSVNN